MCGGHRPVCCAVQCGAALAAVRAMTRTLHDLIQCTANSEARPSLPASAAHRIATARAAHMHHKSQEDNEGNHTDEHQRQ